ncbi:MAG: hypothetical protein PUB11_04600 [Oscillospiraceae bacterium]|nr:hypothetical protein [Oscillospiraceae bacterium]
MKNKSMNRIPSGLGFVSVLVFFSVMCFTALGALSFSSAMADKRLTDEIIENDIKYFEAYSDIQKQISQVDRDLNFLLKKGNFDKKSITETVRGAYENGGEIYIKLSSDIDDNRYILAELKVLIEQSEAPLYSVMRVKTIANTDIKTDEHIPVYQ